MNGLLKDHTLKLIAELTTQIVPPAIMAAFAAHEISIRTAFNFAEAAGLVAVVLIICTMFHSVRT